MNEMVLTLQGWLLAASLPEIAKYLLISIGVITLLYIIVSLFTNQAIIRSTPVGSPVATGEQYYCLPKAQLKIKALAKLEVTKVANGIVQNVVLQEQNFTVERLMVADTANRFSLNYVLNAFSNDELVLKATSQGLLDSINAVAEDRFGETVGGVAAAPALIFKKEDTDARLDASEETTKETIEVVKEFVEDPASMDTESKTKVIQWSIRVDGWSTDIQADFILEAESPLPAATSQSGEPSFDGIFTRPQMTILFTISSGGQQDQKITSESFALQLPDTGQIIKVPIKRGYFIKRQHELGFTEGSITAHTIKKPSEAEAFVSIPVNILKAIVSIPAQLISFTINNTKVQKDLETEKAALQTKILAQEREARERKLRDQEELLKAQKDLVKAQNDLKLAQEQTAEIEELKKKVKELEAKIKSGQQ